MFNSWRKKSKVKSENSPPSEKKETSVPVNESHLIFRKNAAGNVELIFEGDSSQIHGMCAMAAAKLFSREYKRVAKKLSEDKPEADFMLDLSGQPVLKN